MRLYPYATVVKGKDLNSVAASMKGNTVQMHLGTEEKLEGASSHIPSHSGDVRAQANLKQLQNPTGNLELQSNPNPKSVEPLLDSSENVDKHFVHNQETTKVNLPDLKGDFKFFMNRNKYVQGCQNLENRGITLVFLHKMLDDKAFNK
jgi:hypothetical protein